MMKKHLNIVVLSAALFANTAYMSAVGDANPAPAAPAKVSFMQNITKNISKEGFWKGVDCLKANKFAVLGISAAAVVAYIAINSEVAKPVREFFGCKEEAKPARK